MSKKKREGHSPSGVSKKVLKQKEHKKAAKKTTKKKVAKKKAAKPKKKKEVKKPNAKLFKNAPKEKVFVLSDGGIVRNPKELADLLEHLRDEIFNHHVTGDKNDFAKWIHDVFKDVELAKKLANAQGRDKTRIVLYRHLVENAPKK